MTAAIPDNLSVVIRPTEEERARTTQDGAHQRSILRAANILNILTGLAILAAFASAIFIWVSLLSTNKNFRDEKRAWIGPDLPTTDEAIVRFWRIPAAAGDLFQLSLPWKNFGAEPALHFRQHSLLAIYPVTSSTDGLQKAEWEKIHQTILGLDLTRTYETAIFPGQTAAGITRGARPVTAEVLSNINAKHYIVVIIGKALYSDSISSSEHETAICVIYAPSELGKPAGWMMCPMELPVT